MPVPYDRTNRKEYPGCVCKISPPEPPAWSTNWNNVVKWAMGGSSSGHSGALKEGHLLCSCTAQQMITHFQPV